LEAERGGRGVAFRLERRLRRRNEKQPVQAQFLDGRLRDEQMAKVNRVKRAAQESEFHTIYDL